MRRKANRHRVKRHRGQLGWWSGSRWRPRPNPWRQWKWDDTTGAIWFRQEAGAMPMVTGYIHMGTPEIVDQRDPVTMYVSEDEHGMYATSAEMIRRYRDGVPTETHDFGPPPEIIPVRIMSRKIP